MNTKPFLVVTTDDLEPAVRLRAALAAEGYTVELLTPGERLADLGRPVDLLLVTGGLRERRGQALVAEARELGDVPVVGLFEPTDSFSFAECRALGLTECLPKPVNTEEVVVVVNRLLERRRLREVTGIAGRSEAIEEVLERVVQIAPVDTTVLLQGESGTGKELVARGIHALSRRRHRPFIAVNVGALPESLLESELFGHEKGAFTGATGLRKGLFELAHGGTIFLDEIGEMPPATQVKLLRVLEEQEFRRVGGEEAIRVDVRVIAATNRDLRAMVESGDFRRDLYHRINVLRIDLPPLRERREDIALLVERFIEQFARQHERPRLRVDPEAMDLLVRYDWPGNVRELRNLVEAMVVLAPGPVLRPQDLPPEIRDGRRRALVPVTAAPVVIQRDGELANAVPELEFVFQTLVELRLDLEDLRRQFERWQQRQRELEACPRPALPPPREAAAPLEPAAMPAGAASAAPPEPTPAPAPAPPDDAIVFRPGMTMADLERQAIQLALLKVRGNRRKAAEMLGIGERTLYRKIKEYGIPL